MTNKKHQLSFYNSLTKQKEVFRPKSGNKIDWYICGPTVYDSPHIGHARTYISFDVIRRVLEDYFGYSVNYAMNITDVDDKIINKAKEIILNKKINDLSFNDANSTKNIDITKVCKELTIKYENEFFFDLKALNVKPPTFLTRVTEFIVQIEKFIEELVDKNMAYKMNDSIYFDINEYRKHFRYPIFVNQSAIKDEDDEESVVLDNKTTFTCEQNDKVFNSVELTKPINAKRNIADFVLWKGRSTDLFYETKLGTGRPGWHIECSTMASNIFPNGLDIHSGGIDLAFPHHENEIAQNQALTKQPWINYFLHTGHLHIDGLKMSKSLKNFITIKDFTKRYTPRQIRLSFLINKWWQPMTYSEDSMQFAINLESKLFNFISILESQISKNEYFINNVCFTKDSQEDYLAFERFKLEIHEALCDNIDTAAVFKAMFSYITNCNTKIDKIIMSLKKVILDYLNKILLIFGLIEKVKQVANGDSSQLLSLFNDLRNDLRVLAKNKCDYKHLYGVCDKLRDELKGLGYIIDDKGDASVIRKI